MAEGTVFTRVEHRDGRARGSRLVTPLVEGRWLGRVGLKKKSRAVWKLKR